MSLVPTWPIIVFGSVFAFSIGAWADHTVMARKYDKMVVQHQQALALATAVNQKRSEQLQIEADESEMKRAVDNDQHAKDLAAVRAAARAGAVRLSIPGACRPTPSAQAGAATGPGQEARTDLLPGTADAAIRIAGRSAEDVFAYNDLLDRYNAVCK